MYYDTCTYIWYMDGSGTCIVTSKPTLTSTMCSSRTAPSTADAMEKTGASSSATAANGVSASAAAANSQYNIGNLVELVHRLQNLLFPVLVLHQLIGFVVRWESPVVTSCVWFVTVIVVYHLETAHMIFCCFMTLASIAGFGYVIRQSRTQALESSAIKRLHAAPATGNTGTTPAQRAGLSRDVEIDRRQKLLEEYRQYMVSSQELLVYCCDLIEYAQDVLIWGDPRVSPIFYASSFVVLVVCAVLPFRWFVILGISSVFGIYYMALGDSLASMGKVEENSERKGASEENKTDAESPPLAGSKEIIQHPEIRIDGASTQTPTPNTPSTEGSIEDDDWHRGSKPASGNTSSSRGNHGNISSGRDRAATAPAESMVKGSIGDKPSESGDHSSSSAAGGQCFQCGVAFTSLLKRRKYCRHCGNDFCSKCCNQKLPRAAFGATAPAAQTEKELVCNGCFLQLTAEEAASTEKS